MVELLAAGEAAMNAGDTAAAARAFRKCAFLDPDQPVADPSAARRAYAAARAALDRSPTAAVEATLEGSHVDELVRLLDSKLTLPAIHLGQ